MRAGASSTAYTDGQVSHTHLAGAGVCAARGRELPFPAGGGNAGDWGAACCVPTDASELTAAALPNDAPCSAGSATACNSSMHHRLAD